MQLTDNYGGDCFELQPPYINNCGFSIAQRFVQTIYQDITIDKNGSRVDLNVSKLIILIIFM